MNGKKGVRSGLFSNEEGKKKRDWGKNAIGLKTIYLLYYNNSEVRKLFL